MRRLGRSAGEVACAEGRSECLPAHASKIAAHDDCPEQMIACHCDLLAMSRASFPRATPLEVEYPIASLYSPVLCTL